ncbi:MAG: endonuclease/exonuclease/phosphatase family protein [Planctomycetes bacterium]|nr:endonuclease/exonuclease/phosphatase family protein [Planctomycetota bacterium]
MQLKVMTWNIHRCFGMDRKFRPDRVIEVIRHHDPDVLLLQEVDRGVPRSNKLWLDHELARDCEYEFHTWAQAHVLKVGSYGNAILSRFPIKKRKVVDLRLGWRKRRNCLYTKLQAPRFRHGLHVFNWHLGLSAMERTAQVKKVLHSGTMHSISPGSAILLAGDCNDWRNLLYHGSGIKTAGFHAWSEHGRRQHIRTYPSPAPLGPLDKFFWRGSLHDEHIHASRLKLAKMASDHLPLVAEFRMG